MKKLLFISILILIGLCSSFESVAQTFKGCISGTPDHVDFTYSTCTRTLILSSTPDTEGDVPGYCGFGCGSVQSYYVQMSGGIGCNYFVSISII